MNDWWKEMASKHPWWDEFTKYNEAYAEIFKRAREQGVDQKNIFDEDYREMSIEEEIELAKLIRNQPDVYYYFEDLAERQKANPDRMEEFLPEYGDVGSSFMDLYWLRQGLPTQMAWVKEPSKQLVLSYARGEVPDLDAPEAKKVLDEYRLNNKVRRFKAGWEMKDA